jgi:hypothetical protein
LITDFLLIVLYTGILASVGYIATGFTDLLSLPPLIVGSMVGAQVAVRLRELLPERIVRIGFAASMEASRWTSWEAPQAFSKPKIGREDMRYKRFLVKVQR